MMYVNSQSTHKVVVVTVVHSSISFYDAQREVYPFLYFLSLVNGSHKRVLVLETNLTHYVTTMHLFGKEKIYDRNLIFLN